MRIHKTVVFALLLSMIALSLWSDERMVIRFTEPDKEIIVEFTKDFYDVAAYSPGHFLDIVVNNLLLQEIIERGYNPIITQTETQIKQNMQIKSERINGYRTYDDIVTEINLLAAQHPEIVRVYNLGDSWAKIYTQEGNSYYQNYQHDIWGVKVTTNPDDANDKPAVYYNGAHHAREPLSAEVTMDFLNLLLDSYQDDNDIAYLIDNTEIWFLPLINPDGHKIVLNQIDVWWRKNIRDNNNNGSFNSYNYYGYGIDGVDLNRNYDFEWGASNDFSQPTYPGPFGNSEPEIIPFVELMQSQHFVAGISYHTYSELVLFPYGYAENVTAPDHYALQDLAVTMAQSIPKLNSPGHYLPQQSVELYPARGTTEDYAYGVHGIFSFTLELGVEFIPSPPDIEQISSDNMEAALILLNRVHNSILTGIVTDSVTGEPVAAEVFIEGIDNTGSYRAPYMSSEAFGRYYRLVLPGDYNVSFSAYGYQDSDLYTVSVLPEGQTVLNVTLNPEGSGLLSGFVLSHPDNEPLSEAIVVIQNTPIEPLSTDENGYFEFPAVSFGNYHIKVTKEGYGTHYEQVYFFNEGYELSFLLYPPFFVDNFNDSSNWQTTGSWGLSSQYAYIGDFSLADSPDGDYQANVTSYARLIQPIDLSNATNGSLTFMARYHLETGYDYCFLQISTDNETWVNLEGFNSYSDWIRKEYPLNSYLGQVVSLRFLFTSDVSIEEEGIYIDNFEIYISDPEVIVEQSISDYISHIYLLQNFPNPFNPTTTISFSLAQDQELELSIYNIRGQKIRSLLPKSVLSRGEHQILWDGKSDYNRAVSSGIYFYKIEGKDVSITKRMVLLK